MRVYTLPDSTTVVVDQQFQIGDQKYPAYWLATASDADMSAAGITVQIVPDPPPPPITSVSALGFRQLFTAAERLGITTAAEQVPAIRVFMDDESSAGEVNLLDPEVTAGINSLVSGGLLTQDRASQILAGAPAPSGS